MAKTDHSSPAVCLAACLLVQPGLVFAQDTPAPATRLETITTTATRNAIPALTYPGMVSVTEDERIQSIQPSSLEDLFQHIPGVTFQGGPRRIGDEPTIRGFDSRNIIIRVDGARQNYNSGHDGRVFLEPDLLKRVEVVRGPTSALYGNGGNGGVIAFETKNAGDFLEPGETGGFRLKTGYQSVSEETAGRLALFGQVEGTGGLLVDVGVRRSSDVELGNKTASQFSAVDLTDAFAKGNITLGRFHDLSLSVIGYRDEVTEPDNGQGVGGEPLVDKVVTSTTTALAYSYDNPDIRWLQPRLNVYFVTNEVEETGVTATTQSPIGSNRDRRVETWGFEALNVTEVMPAGIDNRLTYGIEYYEDSQTAFDSRGAGGIRAGVPNADASYLGLFLQDEITLDEGIPGKLTLIPGIRYDRYETSSAISRQTEETAVSPKLALSYAPIRQAFVFGSWAKGFRAPTFDELYASGIHFPYAPNQFNRFVPNPDLRPETTETYEVGGGLSFRDWFDERDLTQFKVARWFTKADDYMDQRVNTFFSAPNCPLFQVCGTTTVANRDATLNGLEAEAVYDHPWLRFSLGYAQVNGKDRNSGVYLGTLTPDTWTAETVLKVAPWDIEVAWRIVAAESHWRVPTFNERQDAYGVHDFAITWRPDDEPWLDGLVVVLGVDNAFNEQYTRVAPTALEPGRNWKATVSYTATF